MGHKTDDKLFINKNHLMIDFFPDSRRRGRDGCRSSRYTGLDANENKMGKASCNVQMQFAVIYMYATFFLYLCTCTIRTRVQKGR